MHSPSAELTKALALHVVAPSYRDGEKEALALAKTGFIDSLAAAFAGAREPLVQILTEYFSSQESGDDGEAIVPISGKRYPSHIAACITGGAAHALDYDDVAMAAHPSAVLVPAILSEGQRLGSSGLHALRAYVVAYDIWSNLYSREPDPYHLKGWHPTSVFGTIAGAAAIAFLNRLSAQQTQHALAIAASLAGGLVANFGTMTKPFHAGRAASCAIEACRLAMLGMTAAPDIFEHRAGFLAAVSPAGRVDRDAKALSLGLRPSLLDTGLSIKRYPVCYSGHRIIDGVLEIVQRNDLSPADVRDVCVTIGPAQASMLRHSRPNNALEAKFSIEFAVSAALVAREVGLGQLIDSFVNRSDVRQQFEKVSIRIAGDPCQIDRAFSFADRVVITTLDGRTFDSGDIRFAIGNAARPLAPEQLRLKFLDCVRFGGVEVHSSKLLERLDRLEAVHDVRSLFA